MASIAKGCFPGRPKKKIEKKKAKFSPHLHKTELNDLKWTCSIITNITQQFHVIFNDTSDEDAHFIGFRSKSVKKSCQSKKTFQSEKFVPSSSKQPQQSASEKEKSLLKPDLSHGSPSKPHFQSSSETDISGSSPDSAFLKYKDSKLDFHRLSRKARNKEVYVGCSAEEQAKRKDTSVASLKYASDIYLAKDHGTIGKSPIKPATFIPPTSSKQMHVSALGSTTLVIKKGPKALSSGRQHFPDQRLKQFPSGSNEPGKKSKVSKSFVLPTKSARSSRIIKANRKYLDSDSEPSGMINLSQSPLVHGATNVPAVECSVRVPRIPVRHDMEMENQKLMRQMEEDATKLSRRKPLIKEPTFQIGSPSGKSKLYNRHKDGAHARAQRLIKRAKFKHSDVTAQNQSAENQRKKIIREATFKAPLTSTSPKGKKTQHRRRKVSSSDEISDLGLSRSTWRILTEPVEHGNEWTIQEIHNVLHGAHTFGASWASVARQYDFHEAHRDWFSVRKKGSKCRSIGLLNSSYKVKSSILLQLKPKISDNPNVTVFTPNELKQRNMSNNITCNLESQMKGEKGMWNNVETHLEGAKKVRRKSSKQSDSSSQDDLYLGLTRQNFHKMTHPRADKKRKWETWEIHNVLHGIHWFGTGEWARIHAMYRFKSGHDNLAIRGKFRSVCYRGLIVDNEVCPDVVSKLRPSLSASGAEYFESKGIPVLQHRSKKKRDMQDVTNTPKHGRRHHHLKHNKRGAKIKQPTLEDSDDSTTISPPRKQAYHLFGTVPVWDDASTPELIGIKSDDTSTPVMKALEDGLRKNSSSSNEASFPSSGMFHADDVTPPSKSDSSQVTSSGHVKNRNVTSKAEGKGGRGRKAQTDTPTNKVVGKGPRIKHVCRRASLVTGQVKATYDDVSPQLSALPKDERDKIAAEAEKLKDHPPQFSSSENEDDMKHPQKNVNPTMVARKEKTLPSRKRHGIPTPCGKCEACMAPPCGECEPCRKAVIEGGDGNDKVLVSKCVKRSSCLHQEVPASLHSKKAKKSEHLTGSRKSSRLQQQKVPLLSSNVPDPSTTRDHVTVGSIKSSTIPSHNEQTFLSPSSYNSSYPDVFSPFKQAIVKMDNWKETYDLDQLWKMGGHSLITSNPAAPRIVCFLCGSLGTSEQVGNRIVHCACCCEPFHVCCADEKHDQPRVLAAMANNTWVCRRCRYCHVCGQTRNLLECRHCRKTYHSECLGPSYPTKESDSGIWVCMRCVRCQSCGASKPGNLPGANWTHDFTMCQRCGDLFDKGNYCPICQRCYSDEDFDTRMVQCAGCKRWVHSKCESLTVEMYTLLSHLPDNVQYKCPDCDNRGVKLKQILEEEIVSFVEPSKGSTPDAEKIRKILSQLPAPPWRTIIEKEIQSGLEEITMALFHNRAMYCTLKKHKDPPSEGASPAHASPGLEDDVTKRPHDLFAVRFAVHNRRYKSLNAFYADVRAILVSVPNDEDRRAVMAAFKEEAGNVFPWFNFETGRIRDVDDVPENLLPHATMPPIPEHDYAQWLDKDITLTPGTPISTPNKYINSPLKSERWSSPSKDAEDLRQCIFCIKYGDDKPMNGGRLLYCGQDEWTHVNCALWSAEVFEQHDGSLQNVHSAASRGKMMKCDYCRMPGATVGCHTRDCPKNYHFMCARNSGCFFQMDKKVYCSRHPQHVKQEVMHDEDFEVHRLVCVDNEEMRPNRRWQRGMQAANITVTVGALTVHQLGKLALASDTRDCLIPISFRVTRVFWSTVSANRKTVYTVTVTDRKPSVDGSDHDKSSGNNMTISHSAEPDRHQAPENEPKSKRLSPRIPCKSKLVDRIDDSPHIGPLSPTRRGSRHHMQENSGTYSIISSINRTLPQLVTPIPARAIESVPKLSQMPPSTLVFPKDNPYLNPPLASTSAVEKVTKPKVTTVSSLPVPTVQTCKPVLGGLVDLPVTLPNTPSLSSDLPKKADPVNSDVNTANVATAEPVSLKEKHTLEKRKDEGSLITKPETLIFGASGSTVQQCSDLVHKGDGKGSVPIISRDGDAHLPTISIPVGTKSQTLESKELPAASENTTVASTSVEQKKSKSFENVSVNTGADPIPHNKVEAVNLANEGPQLLDTKNENLVSKSGETESEASATIALIKNARKAGEVEKSKPTKSPTVDTASLWWHKQSNTSSQSSSLKRDVEVTKRSASDEDIAQPQRRLRSSSRSVDNDPGFVPSPKEKSLWKRLPGESGLEAASRISRQSRDRACKVSVSVTDISPKKQKEDQVKDGTLENKIENVASPKKKNNKIQEAENKILTIKDTDEKQQSLIEKYDNACKDDNKSAAEQSPRQKMSPISQPVVVLRNCDVIESDSCSSSNSDSADKKVSLRRFTRSSAKNPPISPVSRERSKSHDSIRTRSQKSTDDQVKFKTPEKTRMRTRHFSSEKPARVSPVMTTPQDDSPPTCEERVSTPPRRYPRRDSFICLKSFSGLSPSYALASYSRSQPKSESTKKSSKKRSQSPRGKKKTKQAIGKQKQQLPKPTLKKLSPQKKTLDDEDDKKSDHNKTEPQSTTASPNCDVETKPEKDIQTSVFPPEEPTIDSGAQVTQDVEEILQEILKSVDEFHKNFSDNKDSAVNSTKDQPEAESKPCTLDDSIEVPRVGGTDDERTVETAVLHVPDTPVAGNDSVDFGILPENEQNRSLSADLSSPKTLVPPGIDIPDQLSVPVDSGAMETLTNDLMSTSECPVLNADEVETLLESPDPPMPQQQNFPIQQQQDFLFAPPPNQFCSPPNAQFHSQPQQPSQLNYQPMGVAPAFNQQLPITTYQPQPVASPHLVGGNSYAAPPIVKRSALNPAQIPANPATGSPLSYSLRVTMAMTGALGNNMLTSSSLNLPLNQMPRQNTGQQLRNSGLEQSLLRPPVNAPLASAPVQRRNEDFNPPQEVRPQGPPGEMNALEHMINYYSAKNNLTPEEKEIVRSIINTQIQTNQLPLPPTRFPAPTAKPVANNKTTKSIKSSVSEKPQKIKKRKTSHEKQKIDVASKVKRRRKEKKSPLQHHEIDTPWSVHPDDGSYDSSCLMDIYTKRNELFKPHKLPYLKSVAMFHKALSMYNIFLGDKKTNRENRLPPPPSVGSPTAKNLPYLIYEIKSDDGYYASGPDLQELINQLYTSVQECRSTAKGGNPCLALSSVMTPHKFLGLSHDAVRFLVEQLPGARHCHRYRAKYHKHKKAKDEVIHINPNGCCRAEKYKGRSKPDMFSFLASKYRLPPEFIPDRNQDDDMLQLSNRRATSMEQLPMAMRFRHLRTFAREAVGVYRSSIHGRGLFCKRDVAAGEMVMEYTGEVIRRELTDKREKFYESKSIGCYMFRMDDLYVVDATMRGSSARFINHSCEPNCYSRIVQVEGKKHIVIFALRKIYRGEELTYDYKFPIEDDTHKISCNCGSRLCRKYMN
uniref:[histone H3]-lysine(4) N-methyltransferase n=1 Tax=Phallusia mammillata TaxID=59560 RepID=A0A6F9DG44_9ASCI|nr:histone-lysine N-methyltransferase 2A [Phallusia mammillata]